MPAGRPSSAGCGAGGATARLGARTGTWPGAGITSEAWDEMFAAQGKRCAICGTDAEPTKGWTTDHCHDAGHVRGILCNGCNAGLGHFKDNPAALRAAAEYLERGA
jgi:hypothetical protein